MMRRPHVFSGTTFSSLSSLTHTLTRHPHLWRWPSIKPGQLQCHGSGQVFIHEPSLDALESVFKQIGVHHINSAHRSSLYNARVGGAPRSAHLFLALDLKLPPTRSRAMLLYRVCQQAGFSSFGFYNSFLHVDMRGSHFVGGRARRWYGSKSARRWWDRQWGS